MPNNAPVGSGTARVITKMTKGCDTIGWSKFWREYQGMGQKGAANTASHGKLGSLYVILYKPKRSARFFKRTRKKGLQLL